MRFKVLVGTHSEDGVEYTAGQTVESVSRLDKVFRGKFQSLDAIEDETGKEPGLVFEAAVLKYGNDITMIIRDDALQAGLHIYHQAGRYRVVDCSIQPEKEITDEPIQRSEINDVVNTYLGIEDEQPELETTTVEE
ncbi:MAG TPA: hypothetical protein VMW91_01510 [Desulfosporosinus sp.]|nr:hypothetical protein [Desulfosporosinus sp.]